MFALGTQLLQLIYLPTQNFDSSVRMRLSEVEKSFLKVLPSRGVNAKVAIAPCCR